MTWPSAWEMVEGRCDRLVTEYTEAGGRSELTDNVHRFVATHREAIDSFHRPVLCHNDLLDSNLLVETTGEPCLTGVVDWERASWGDPLSDLARTKVHAAYHEEAAAQVFVTAYGVQTQAERRRLAVHEVLHRVEERTWISRDRPLGWAHSLAGLDALSAKRPRRADKPDECPLISLCSERPAVPELFEGCATTVVM